MSALDPAWLVGAGFLVLCVFIIGKLIFSRTPDLTMSVGEKVAIIARPEGHVVQMKCSFSAPNGPAEIIRMRVVVNGEAELVPKQFIADFANPYIGAKAQIAPLKADPEVHEAIEFVSIGRKPQWKHGENLLLMKLWVHPNTTEHNPSKMYRIKVYLDDHALGQLAKASMEPSSFVTAHVREILQVYPVPSFTLVSSSRLV